MPQSIERDTMSGMTRQEASAQIAEILAAVNDLLSDAEDLAEAHGIGFSWGGPAYGMGGYYSGTGRNPSEDGGWIASSQSC